MAIGNSWETLLHACNTFHAEYLVHYKCTVMIQPCTFNIAIKDQQGFLCYKFSSNSYLEDSAAAYAVSVAGSVMRISGNVNRCFDFYPRLSHVFKWVFHSTLNKKEIFLRAHAVI
jgi:hypothetical protein